MVYNENYFKWFCKKLNNVESEKGENKQKIRKNEGI